MQMSNFLALPKSILAAEIKLIASQTGDTVISQRSVLTYLEVSVDILYKY